MVMGVGVGVRVCVVGGWWTEMEGKVVTYLVARSNSTHHYLALLRYLLTITTSTTINHTDWTTIV